MAIPLLGGESGEVEVMRVDGSGALWREVVSGVDDDVVSSLAVRLDRVRLMWLA